MLVREGRIDRIAHYFFEVVPRWLVHVDTLYVTELAQPNPLVRRPRTLTIRTVEAKDVKRLHEVFPRGTPAAYEDRLRQGHRGFVCEANRELVAMSWVNLGATHAEPEKFCSFAIPEDAAWAYDLWILPEWRLRGAMVAMVYHTFDYVREHDRRRLCGYMSWHNTDSLKAHVSFGHEVVGELLVVNILGFRVLRGRRLEPNSAVRTHVGFRPTPVIDLLSPQRGSAGGVV